MTLGSYTNITYKTDGAVDNGFFFDLFLPQTRFVQTCPKEIQNSRRIDPKKMEYDRTVYNTSGWTYSC